MIKCGSYLFHTLDTFKKSIIIIIIEKCAIVQKVALNCSLVITIFLVILTSTLKKRI